MVKYVLLTGNFYLVSQEEFWKNVKVTYRKDCRLAGIQGFQSVQVLGEYLALNAWQNPIEAHAEGFSFPDGGCGSWLSVPEPRCSQVGASHLLGVPQVMYQTTQRCPAEGL